MDCFVALLDGREQRITFSTVIPAKAGIQYSRGASDAVENRSVLDTPQGPVIGLAEGETRWRGMTVFVAIPRPHTHAVIPGCAAWRTPGIHNHDREYGFRARAFARPGMTRGASAVAARACLRGP
jgi:hypothetical protein